MLDDCESVGGGMWGMVIDDVAAVGWLAWVCSRMVGADDVAAAHYREVVDHLRAVEDKDAEVSYKGEGGGAGR